MTKTTDLQRLFLDLANGCLVAAARWRESDLPGAQDMHRRLLADADRYAAKAEAAAR